MFCSQCGKKLNQDARYCDHCGKKTAGTEPALASSSSVEPKDSKRTKGKHLLFGACGTAVGAILLAAILLVTGVLSLGGTGTIEGPGFATAEDAAKAYLIGLQNQDVEEMLSTFAVESYAKHYDFAAMLERLMSYQPALEMRLPITDEYTQRLNIEGRRNQIVNGIVAQYMTYNTPDELNDYTPTVFNDPAVIAEFVEKFESNTQDYVFADIKITGTMKPEDMSEMYLSEQNQRNIERQSKVFGVGADDVANIVITFEANGHEWLFCPQAIRYDGKWYLQYLQGNIADLLGLASYTGGIVSVDEFNFSQPS